MVIIEGLGICGHLMASGRKNIKQLNVTNCCFMHLRHQPWKRSVFLMMCFKIGPLWSDISHTEKCPLILVDVATALCCPSAVSCMLHASHMYFTRSRLLTWTSSLCRSLVRWRVIESAGCNCHPVSVDSEHSVSCGSDFLQSSQEQRKSSEHRGSF